MISIRYCFLLSFKNASLQVNSSSGVKLSVDPGPFAPEDPFCAACQFFVEKFYVAWMIQTNRQISRAQARGGDRPLAVPHSFQPFHVAV